MGVHSWYVDRLSVNQFDDNALLPAETSSWPLTLNVLSSFLCLLNAGIAVMHHCLRVSIAATKHNNRW